MCGRRDQISRGVNSYFPPPAPAVQFCGAPLFFFMLTTLRRWICNVFYCQRHFCESHFCCVFCVCALGDKRLLNFFSALISAAGAKSIRPWSLFLARDMTAEVATSPQNFQSISVGTKFLNGAVIVNFMRFRRGRLLSTAAKVSEMKNTW